MASESTLRLGYWGIRGLGAPIRMMIMHKDVPFVAEMLDNVEQPDGGLDGSAWGKRKAELRAKHPLINLPFLIDGDVMVVMSSAIMAYLGRKLGMRGDNERDSTRCEELLAELFDLRNKMVDFAYGTKPDADVAKAAKSLLDVVQDPNSGSFPKLEAVLEAGNTAGGGTYLVSGHATAPDFHLWGLLEQCRTMAKFFGHKDPLASFPHLAGFYTKFAELPANARYFALPIYTKTPFNDKSATFGSLPGGGRWMPGMPCDWHGLGDVY